MNPESPTVLSPDVVSAILSVAAAIQNPPQPALYAGEVFDHVMSGLVWSGDSYGSTRAASMTAGTIRTSRGAIAVAAVTARTFTASKDTYVDALDNGNGTATLVYTEVANNAASPALAANSIRIAIIVTAAGSIAAVGSVNQGEEGKVLPIASSIPYQVTDSLGNLICPRDPFRRQVGRRQITSNLTTASTSVVQATGLTVPIIVPAGRKVRVTAFCVAVDQTTANAASQWEIWEGTPGSGTKRQQSNIRANGTNGNFQIIETTFTPLTTNPTINLGWLVSGGTGTINANSVFPVYLSVELV